LRLKLSVGFGGELANSILAIDLSVEREARKCMNQETNLTNMGNKQCKLFNGAPTLKEKKQFLSTIEIRDELRDSLGNRKYWCAIEIPNSGFLTSYDEIKIRDHHESSCCFAESTDTHAG